MALNSYKIDKFIYLKVFLQIVCLTIGIIKTPLLDTLSPDFSFMRTLLIKSGSTTSPNDKHISIAHRTSPETWSQIRKLVDDGIVIHGLSLREKTYTLPVYNVSKCK